MGFENFSIKFTDETYASKNQVKSALNTSLIYKIYAEVLNYRKSHSRNLNLITYDSRGLTLTETSTLKDIYSSFETSITSLCNNYFSTKLSESNETILKNSNLFDCLSAVNSICDLHISDLTIKAIISGAYRENNPAHQTLIQYKKALDYFDKHATSNLDEEYCARLYEILSDTTELTEFYRVSEFTNRNTSALIGAKRDKAPVRMIEEMMEEYFEFACDSSIKPTIRALVTLFYINYVKPFVNFNNVISILLAKSILAHDLMSSLASSFPLETVLLRSALLDDYWNSIDEDNDATFIVIYGINCLKPLIKNYLDNIIRIRNSAIKEEMKEVSETDLAPFENEPVIEEKKVVVEPKVEPKKEETKVAIAPKKPIVKPTVEVDEKIVLAIQPKVEVMSEKEIKDTANYLLEINPNLSKHQATFFASHCRIGRYYSIQDFKKYCKCAYETARTSMDNLVVQGFYDKIKIKNKFVYTPIKQGEGE